MIRERALEGSARAEVFALRHRVAELEKQLADARKKKPPTTVMVGGSVTTPELEALIERLSHPTQWDIHELHQDE